MASITRESNGRRTIQFLGADRKRRSIRLGKVAQRTAEAVKVHIERLAYASITKHAPDDETARWLASLDDAMFDKLAAVGLVANRERQHPATLQAFLDGYVAGRPDVKQSTSTVYGHTRRCLIAYFGADKALRDITPGEADDWRIWLAQHEGLADNTVRRRCGIAKQFFKAAVRKHLIDGNPFADLTAAVRANAKRAYFITREDAKKVIDACPDAQWRLLFALSRYGGLRCPSEHLALRWEDVDWHGNRMTVHSPKTEHHEGGESRVIPIFPELRPYLVDAWEQAEPGTEYVITVRRDAKANVRTRLYKIIKRAGLKPWPKLLQNLRSTRETELAESYPIHVVCAWIGNSAAVAAKHYLQVTDEHYRQAATAAEATTEAVQNPVQQSAETACKPSKSTVETTATTSPNSLACDNLRESSRIVEKFLVGDEGLEPAASTV